MSTRSVLSGVLREPTLHFALLAAALFAVTAIVTSDDGNVVEIDRNQIEFRILQLEAELGGPLSVEERMLVEDAYIEERILIQEARALGLEEDERIDDILVQKMLHVLSGEVIQPTQAMLEAYYAENRTRYVSQRWVDADEIVVPLDGPQGAALPSQVQQGTPPGELVGDVLLAHRVLPEMTRDDLTQIFSAQMAETVLASETGAWVGPYESVRGYHWLRVSARAAAEQLPLEVVREEVRLDWIGEQEQALLDERVAELRGYYSVVFTGGGPEP